MAPRPSQQMSTVWKGRDQEGDVGVSPPDCWIAFRTDLRDMSTAAGPAWMLSVQIAGTAALTRLHETVESRLDEQMGEEDE